VLFSNVIEGVGAPTLAPGPVLKGQPVLSIPFRYRYTAVLTEDVLGFSFTVKGIQAPLGSPGYYAGTFALRSSPWDAEKAPPMDMWCFLPRVAGGKRENICLLRDRPKHAAIAPTGMNPYLWYSFAPMTGSFDYVYTPIFKRQHVELPFSPILEYRFMNWEKDSLWLQIYTMGKRVRDLNVPIGETGEYRIRTIGGDFKITKSAGNPKTAEIKAVENPL
jgi:hypothetical protein